VSLLRSPKSPDPEADIGSHEFAYALMPHAGGWREGGVLREATLFNAPLRWTTVAPAEPFAIVEGGLVLETIKRAEDSDALVLRLYEPYGGRGVARVHVDAVRAWRTNLLEDQLDDVEVDAGALVLAYRPREVITVKVAR
jgi:alpha-mannosidase